MLVTLAGIVGSGMAMSFGTAYGTVEGAWLVLGVLCAIFVPLCASGLMAERKNTQLPEKVREKDNQLFAIAKRYNAVTELLEESYREEKRSLSRGQREALRQKYEREYLKNKHSYELEKEKFLAQHEASTPQATKLKRYWKTVIIAGIIAQLSACGYTMGALTEEVPESASTVMQSGEVQYWNAENIPMPHLQDASRWVSNPDGVVSTETEALLNQWLSRLNDSLGIETVMILVNHIENDDPYRMAIDVGNKYGVGKGDRGLMVVLGYEDHSINISPGRSLEADLTDAECHRLQQRYVIPSMRAEQPDSGMLYLAEAIYNLLQSKELPEMSNFTANTADEDDTVLTFVMIYLLLFGGWAVLIAWLAHRYNGAMSASWFKANPFVAEPQVFVVSGGGGHSHIGRGGGFGGGGFSGGSFGGGSFGGGGATSRW
jgi:uncharacterized membrane protein YgcG